MSVSVVVGAGAVGAAVALHLQNSYLPFVLFGRDGIQDKPLTVTLREQMTLLQPLATSRFHWRDADCVFICVKVYDLTACLAAYAPLIPAGATVIITANGAIDGFIRDAIARYPGLHWRLGIAQLGSTEVPGGFALAGNGGSVTIGWEPGTPVSSAEQRLAAAAPKFFRVVADITPAYRQKWLMNVVANSYTGAHRLRRNELLLAPEHQIELRAVLHEGYELGKRLWGAWQQNEEELWRYFLTVVQATAENENSMARDVRLGRKTESEYLAGKAQQFAGFPRLKSLHKSVSET